MSFAVRYLVLVLFTAGLLAASDERWRKYNRFLMAGYLIAVGVIFLI